MATTEQEFEIGSTGAVASIAAPVCPPSEEETAIGIIQGMIEDPEVPVSVVSRQIAIAMVGVMKKMATNDPLHRGRSQTEMNNQIRAFSALQKTVTESEILARKDPLNLDGPKFQLVFNQILSWIEKALLDSKIDPGTVKNVMKHFADLAAKGDAELRKSLTKIESGR